MAERTAVSARTREMLSDLIEGHSSSADVWTAARGAKAGRHCGWMNSAGNDQLGLIDDSQEPWQMKRVPERLSEVGQGWATRPAHRCAAGRPAGGRGCVLRRDASRAAWVCRACRGLFLGLGERALELLEGEQELIGIEPSRHDVGAMYGAP